MADDLPPLPPGAVLSKPQTALPPLPPGAVPVAAAPKQNSDIVTQAGSVAAAPFKAAAAGLGSIKDEALKEGHEAWEGLKGDINTPVTAKGGKPPGFMDYAARGGTMLGHLASGGFAIPNAAVKQTLGRSVQEATGGVYDPQAVTDAAMIVGPDKGKFFAGAASKVEDGMKAVEKLFSPTTVSPSAGATERVIRRATGEASLANEKAAERLVQHNNTVSNMPVPQQRAMVDYIENRSNLPPGAKMADPKAQAAADDIGKVYDDWRTRVQKVLPASATPKFIEDYYAHIWKEKPSVVGEKLGSASRQGSGRSFKQRTIPTISDGIKAGLTPKFENPIETTMAYSQNMARYVATHDMLGELKTQGYAKWYSPGSKNVPPDWVPLDGIMTKKTAPGRTNAAGQEIGRPIELYAPPAVARVFNNYISKGLEQGDNLPLWEGARQAANGLTMLKLGLSTFHLSTIANEAMISEMARGFRALSKTPGMIAKGDIKGAGREALTGAKAIGASPAAPIHSAMRGLKMQRELLDKVMPDSMSKKVNDAFVRSGGQLRMDPFYRTRSSGSFFNAIEKGTMKRELKDAADKLYKGTPYENAKGAVDLAANVIQSTAAPLFEKYIPMVKRGAFSSEMTDYIKANPAATQAEIDKEAVLIADSIDNRFGELNQDNLFWQRWMKQVSQILLLSPTWNLGTVRDIGGGIKDAMGALPAIAKGEGVTRRTAYVAALAAQTALINGVATYMKTGQAPQGKDYMAYRTGGTNPTGSPERAMTPGYQKDAYAFGYDFPHHIIQESENKLNPALSTVAGLVTNKDYRGLPILRPEGVAPIPGEPGLMDFALDTLMPISVGQLSKGNKKGSNISPPERAMSIRPAPGYISDTQRMQDLQTKYGSRDWRRRIRADKRLESQQQ
jgi:hypothetical protein